MKEKVIPYSREAEVYVLGSILVEPDLANEFCGNLSIDDFYVSQNKDIYQAIESLYLQKKDVSVINVIETLKTYGKYESVGEEYLFQIVDSVPSIVTAEDYVKVLKERSLERELYYEAKEISRKVLSGEQEIKNLLFETEERIRNVVNKQKVEKMELISVVTDEVFRKINENAESGKRSLIGLDTGFKELNDYTLGFQPGELIILAARPGVGKSSFALSIALKSCRKMNPHIAFFSLEMSNDQLVMRLLSMASTVPLKKIRSGDICPSDSNFLLRGRITLDSLNIYLDETTSNSIEDVKIKCRKLKREGKLDFIIIDYLQLLSASKGNKNNFSRYEEVTLLSRSLKLLARELKVPLMALSQLSRAAVTKSPKEGNRPSLSDLKESGSIEQDADIVLFLFSEKKDSDEIILYVAKNRQGETGDIPLIFNGECTAFESAEKK